MKRCVLFLIMCLNSMPAFSDDHCVIRPQANIVLLKFDDITGITKKWQKITDYLESNKISASYGVIGDSLENDNPAYFAWLKERVKIGQVELWNHGYVNHFKTESKISERGEFDGTSAEAQAYSLSQTQWLTKQKIGVTLNGFGPHNSAIDEKTYPLLVSFPEIKYVWFYKPIGDVKHPPFLFQRVANLEQPIFRPNADLFIKDYPKRPQDLGYIALQGHPNMWNDQDFEQFTRIINYLKNEKVQFCRPSDVLSNK